MAKESKPTISKDQLKRLCEDFLKETHAVLKNRDKSDKAMDKKSALLQALYIKLQEKLGIKPVNKSLPTRGFKTYEFAYREAIYELLSQHAKEAFEYRPIVNGFLDKALK